jgi:putative hydrolase of the HAD superfamily
MFMDTQQRGFSCKLKTLMMSKRYLWFDLGYTLLYLKIDKPMKKLLKASGYEFPLEKIRKTFHLCDKHFMRKYPGVLGKGRSNYMVRYLETFIRILEISVDKEDFTREWLEQFAPPIEMWAPFPCVGHVLQTLVNADFRLGLITNWDSSARPILEKHKLAGYFDTIVISSEVGMEKPSREIFSHALRLAGAKAEESVYIGDNYYDDTIGARRVGMDSVIINRFGRLGVEEIDDVPFVPDIRHLLQAVEQPI